MVTLVLLSSCGRTSSSETCDSCIVSLKRVAQLGTDDGPGALGGTGTVARSPGGLFFVATARMLDEIKVFDSDGRFLRTIGRAGAGPGEFRHIWLLSAVDNTLYAFDGDNDRVTTLRLPDGEIVSEQPWKWPARSVAILKSRSFVINADISIPALAGVPLHLLSSDGEIARSFGETEDLTRPDVGYAGQRVLAASNDGNVWSAPRTSYVMTKWSPSGRVISTIDRDAAWFRPHRNTVSFTADRPPPPLVVQMREDAWGRLWILSSVADESWQEGLEFRPDHPDGPRYVPGNLHDYFDTVIEVVDTRTGELLASGRSDRYITRFADDEHVVSFAETAIGAPRIEVWRISLSPRLQEDS